MTGSNKFQNFKEIKKLYFLIMGLIVLCNSIFLSSEAISGEEELVVKIRAFRNDLAIKKEKEYKYMLLDLILAKTKDEYGPYRIEVVPHPYTSQHRMVDLLDANIFSLYITMTSKEREKSLLPIRIPVYKGLYGYRVFIIRKGDQKRFDDIEEIDDLRRLWAGQGLSWPDTRILEANGFNVETTNNTNSLFGMLREERFDYFPRGVHEPWRELADLDEPTLTVEQKLLIHYPAPGYIFLSKKQKKLAERLEKGFRQAISDGSFDKFYYSHDDIVTALKNAKIEERKLFRLHNPLLTTETPLDNPKLWLRGQDNANEN